MSLGLEVLACGARTPVGLTAASSAAAARAGISRLRAFPFATRTGDPLIVATDGDLDDRIEGRDRMQPMLRAVFDEIVETVGGPKLFAGGCDVLLSVPEARPGFAELDAKWLEQSSVAYFQEHGVPATVSVAGRGHAGGIAAIQTAGQLVARRPNPLIFVVGVESYISVPTFMWLESRGQLGQPTARNGFNPGEAAAGLLLTTKAVRRQLGAKPLALVEGVGTARESLLRDSDTGSLGVGLAEAVHQACASLRLPDEAVDQVLCDLNSERYRSEEWGLMALRAWHTMRQPQYVAPADVWGDVGAAFGTLAAVLAVQAFERGYRRGPRAMVMAGSDSGLRAAMVLVEPQ